MDLLEHQGKEFFRRHGVATPAEGAVCRTPEEVEDAASAMGGEVVVKAQVKTGGRGKAGGIKLADSPEGARKAAEGIFGLDISGHTVEIVYVEPATDIAEEYYLSAMLDRERKGYLVICSREGGVDIEEVNRTNPEAVTTELLFPSEVRAGLPRGRALEIVRESGLAEEVEDEVTDLLCSLFNAFRDGDALLTEINPLVRTTDDEVVALDAKVTLDGNALFRHDDYAEWREFDLSGDSLEAKAARQGIQYVKLDGDVGVLGNGAGLVMATIDVVAQAGGRPANFLDIGGGASADVMAESIGLVLEDPQVRSVLVNIYGGITRGEEVANGLVEAMERLGEVEQKIVLRLDGTNAEEGREIIDKAGLANVVSAGRMDEAAKMAVELARDA
jgi:succinyl-CoA synthetase beta subunit